MPSSLDGNSLATIGNAPAAGPGPMVAPPGDGGPDPGAAGNEGAPGGAPPGGGQLPPELMQMALAAKLAPQVYAQQQQEYVKKTMTQLISILREIMRVRGLPPKVVSRTGAGVTALQAAIKDFDKDKPEDAPPVASLLAQGMQSKPMMASTPPMNRLPVTR